MGAHHGAVVRCPLQRPLTGVVILLNPWKWVVLSARAPWGLAPSRGCESSRPRVLSLSECRGSGPHDQSIHAERGLWQGCSMAVEGL